MNANGRSFDVLKSNAEYIIPFFQRPYVWGKDEWEDLLATLSKKEGSHFIGSVIAKHSSSEQKQPGDYDKYEIVDGQQRFTTVSILLRAIYDLTDPDVRDAKNIRNYLWYVDIKTKEKHSKVVPSKLDAKPFAKIIVGKGLEKKDIDEINDESSKIEQCYKYFYNQLSSKDEEYLLSIFDVLTSETLNILVFIVLSKEDNEQEIFDSVNNKGIPLTSSDTIKNAIFEKALKLAGKDKEKRNEVMEQYRLVWEDFFYASTENQNFWDKEKATGRIKRTNLDIFFSCFAVIEKIYDVGSSTINDLAQSYKKYIEDKTYPEMMEMIRKINDYATAFYTYMEEYDKSKEIDFNNQIQRLLFIFESFSITTWYPYFLWVVCKYPSEPDLINEKFKDLETYIMRSYIARATSITKNFNKNCSSAINGSFDIKSDLKELDIADDKIKEGVSYMKSNNLGNLVMFIIELSRRQTRPVDKKKLENIFTLEHIMPQKYEEHWGFDEVPVYDEEGNQVVDPIEAEKIRKKAIYSVGNFTLVNKSLNSSLSNNTFVKKVNGEGKHAGYKSCSDVLITREDVIADVYDQKVPWDERQIFARERKLLSEILKIWAI